jgi:hypothetical protein
MTTISGLSASVISGYTIKSGSVNTNAASTNAASANPSSLTGVFTALSGSSSAPLTYNAAGLLGSTTSAQTAQDAVIAAQNAMTQTLDSMMSGSQTKSSAADLFGSGTPPGQTAAPRTNTTGKMTAQTAQQAYLDAQNVITQSLNSIA